MDDQEKLRIRKKAKRRFIRSVIALVALWALWFFYETSHVREQGGIERRLSLNSHRMPFLLEFARFWRQCGTDLAVYPPPSAATEKAEWADQIVAHFGYPVPVFVERESGIEWVANPPPADEQTRVAQKLDSIVHDKRHAIYEFGGVEVRHGGYEAGKKLRGVFRASRGDQAWGVITDSDWEWLAFFRDLSTPRGTPLTFGGPAWMLNNQLVIPASSARDWLPSFGAYLHDSLVFASPNLKLTRDSLHVDYLGGPHVEFFAAPRDFSYLQQSGMIWLMRVFSLFPLVMILPIYRWYRTVRQLTESKAT
jgi:hypothetical protein